MRRVLQEARQAVGDLAAGIFLGAGADPPTEMVLGPDPTGDPPHGNQKK